MVECTANSTYCSCLKGKFLIEKTGVTSKKPLIMNEWEAPAKQTSFNITQIRYNN